MRFSVIYIKEQLLNNCSYLTKETIISDNETLLRCVSIYLLTHITIYVYIVCRAWRILLSATTATKNSQTLVLTFPNISVSKNKKITHHICRFSVAFGSLTCQNISDIFKVVLYNYLSYVLCNQLYQSKQIKPNGFKGWIIDTLFKWSKIGGNCNTEIILFWYKL